MIQFNDIVIIHNEEYEYIYIYILIYINRIWERAIDIANGIYSKIHPLDETHDIKLIENSDEDIIISKLVDDIVRLMPNGIYIYLYIN